MDQGIYITEWRKLMNFFFITLYSIYKKASEKFYFFFFFHWPQKLKSRIPNHLSWFREDLGVGKYLHVILSLKVLFIKLLQSLYQNVIYNCLNFIVVGKLFVLVLLLYIFLTSIMSCDFFFFFFFPLRRKKVCEIHIDKTWMWNDLDL